MLLTISFSVFAEKNTAMRIGVWLKAGENSQGKEEGFAGENAV